MLACGLGGVRAEASGLGARTQDRITWRRKPGLSLDLTSQTEVTVQKRVVWTERHERGAPHGYFLDSVLFLALCATVGI